LVRIPSLRHGAACQVCRPEQRSEPDQSADAEDDEPDDGSVGDDEEADDRPDHRVENVDLRRPELLEGIVRESPKGILMTRRRKDGLPKYLECHPLNHAYYYKNPSMPTKAKLGKESRGIESLAQSARPTRWHAISKPRASIFRFTRMCVA
jgi:hypothetical protein